MFVITISTRSFKVENDPSFYKMLIIGAVSVGVVAGIIAFIIISAVIKVLV